MGPLALGVHVALPPTHPIRVLLADRRRIAASGLAVAFENAGDLVVQASCHETPQLSIVLGSTSGVDAVVIDAEMFDGDASSAVDTIHRLDLGVAILVLTTRVDRRLLEALAHERVSCVSAYSDAQAILVALRALLNGQTLLPPEVQQALTDMLRQPASPPGPSLTVREQQVLELAAIGLTISEIGARLHISHSTAKTHLLRVYEKLGAPNRSAAVATALGLGMLRPSTAAA